MKQIDNRLLLVLIIAAGALIGILKGSEARQKWLFKIKNRHEEKRQYAENQRMIREGGVDLDDFEMASFHRI